MTKKRLNLRFETADELFAGMPELADDVQARPSGEPALDFVAALLEGETPEEALTVSAYNLPVRHAVWWGHECLMKVKDVLNDNDRAMLSYAAAWVSAPDEETRNAALIHATADQNPTPGTWIAYGAGWSGGSMNPPDLPNVPAAPHLTPKAINAGVLTALAAVEIDMRAKTIGSFVKMARQLAEDG